MSNECSADLGSRRTVADGTNRSFRFGKRGVNASHRLLRLAANLVLSSVVATTVSIAGCGRDSSTPPSRLTSENFDAVEKGMSKVQVIQVLGRWREEVPDMAGKAGSPPNALLHCRWRDGLRQIDVTFDGDKMISKSSSGFNGSL